MKNENETHETQNAIFRVPCPLLPQFVSFILIICLGRHCIEWGMGIELTLMLCPFSFSVWLLSSDFIHILFHHSRELQGSLTSSLPLSRNLWIICLSLARWTLKWLPWIGSMLWLSNSTPLPKTLRFTLIQRNLLSTRLCLPASSISRWAGIQTHVTILSNWLSFLFFFIFHSHSFCMLRPRRKTTFASSPLTLTPSSPRSETRSTPSRTKFATLFCSLGILWPPVLWREWVSWQRKSPVCPPKPGAMPTTRRDLVLHLPATRECSQSQYYLILRWAII